MNYQYNQPPPPPPRPPFPPPAYINALEAKRKRKENFEKLSDKMANFCRSNPALAAISGASDILSYVITGLSVVTSIIMMLMGSIYTGLTVTSILLGVAAVSKKTALPLAVSLSGVALVKLVNLVFTVVFMASASRMAWYSDDASRLATAYLFQIIFILVELAVLSVLVTMAWQHFAATLPPKPVVPMYGGQTPQQPVQNFGQPPAQNFQQAQEQAASPEQTAPAAPQSAAGVCPNCGKENRSEAIFCFNCGKKL